MKISALWPDGTLITGASWSDLEEQVRAQQWTAMNVQEFRREMSRRAVVWCGKPVSVADAESMFRGLEQLDIIRLDVTDE